MNHARFTFHRLWAIVLKEFIQMRRDRVTFGMMIGIPLIQLMLFGFAINSDPRHLPTAIDASQAVINSNIKAGLAAAREAVDIRCALAAERPDAFRPYLATSLAVLSNCLDAAGDPSGALAAVAEALATIAPVKTVSFLGRRRRVPMLDDYRAGRARERSAADRSALCNSSPS